VRSKLNPRTYGPAFVATLDGARLRRQRDDIAGLMLDGAWRTLAEIENIFRARGVSYPQASISAQLRHLRKPVFGWYLVEKRRRGRGCTGLWEYRVSVREIPARPEPVQLSLLGGVA
jgi:hypothetical protein